MTAFRFFRSWVAACALSVLGGSLAAAEFPSKPITIILPFATGGGLDASTRALARGMQTALGVPVIVENKTGASGTIGANLVRQAPADGHTLLVGTTNLLSFPRSVLPGRSYDPVTDFVPISGLFRSDLIIAVPVKSPARNMGELVEMARKAPGRMSYGSYGLATTTHFCIEELKRRTGTHIVHVPYRGGPTMDLAGGQLDVSCDVIPAVAPLARDGRLRILGVAAPVRSSFLPDVPTVAEQGFAGFSVFTWSAVMAPKGTPAPVVETLHRVITKVIGSAEFKEQARRVAYETWATTPAELTAFIAEETVKWQKLVTEANITLK